MKKQKAKKTRSNPLSRFKGKRIAPALFSIAVLLSFMVISLAVTLVSNRVTKVNAALQVDKGQPTATEEQPISESALKQIQALIDEKESRTPAQRKIDSQLLYSMKMQRGEPVADGVQRLETDVVYDDDGRTVVDITARVTDALLKQLRDEGSYIINSYPRYNSIRALVNAEALERIADIPAIFFIQPKQESMTSLMKTQEQQQPVSSDDLPAGFRNRADRVREYLGAALSKQANGEVSLQNVGSRGSEGDLTHKAASARGTFGVTGSGIKIGVLSDGVTNLAASQALGDLGPVTVLPGQTGSGDEGTAMLEIVHDLAPGAQLFFATALPTSSAFAQNIRDLRAAGCDIIVDDVFYFAETPFQDGQAPTVISNTNGGIVTQAVNDVTAAGALYFSSAGNSGNLNDGTSGAWEGDFVDGGASGAPLPAGSLHNFGGQNFNTLTVANTSGAPISLYWSDPLGGSSNDYDLFRLNAAGTAIAASSTNIQSGTQDPLEQISQSTANPRIVVLKKAAAAARFLHLNANRGRFSIVTSGTTRGHGSAANAYSVAATPAATPFGPPPNPVGPFPNPFSSTNTLELFSSDGPRRLFFQPNGTPFTPGNFSSTGGILRQKPDITAADGTTVTGVGNFPTPFFGTSAAAPHAAAIAGLIKSANAAFTPAQIRTALISTAIDIEAPGVDRDSGAGIIMVFEALQALGVQGTANLELGTTVAMENPGDADGQIEPGEGAKLTVQLKNTGVLPATNISAALTTSTPGVTITQPNVSLYPDLPALNGMANNITPFTFTLSPNVPCAASIDFTLTVTYAGGPSPRVFTFSISTAPAPVVISSTLDTTPPASNPLFTAATGLQNARLFRANPPGTCGPAKVCPGPTGTGTRQFDAYTFATCPSTAPYCVTVTLTNACTGNKQLFSSVYAGTYNPTNLCTNYLADSAASNTVGGPISFQVTIPAGSSFVVVVSDVNTGVDSALGCNYTLQVSGACVTCETHNQLPVAVCQNVTVPAGPTCTANASINNGSFDPENGPLTITQSPAGPYPAGVTNVLLTVVDNKGATSQCTGTVTVVDNTPPAITCPANILQVAPATCPITTAIPVNYVTPTAVDNCSGLTTVTCTPPSGAIFPVGTTTVTCSSTDSSNNTGSCSFTVSLFSMCLQDDSVPGNTVLFNPSTGEYRYCCNGVVLASGTGTATVRGCTIEITHNLSDRRVSIKADTSAKRGTASLQMPAGQNRCIITDKNMLNNSCNCS